MDHKKIIGMRINAALAKTNTLQKELAKELGVTDNTISYYCNGNRAPSIEQLIKIARFLNISTDYLLGISDTKTLDTTAQAIIAYTGLSEDNVRTLHYMKENGQESLLVDASDTEIVVDGCKPYLDCLNDLLDAIYSKKDTIIRDYILMQHYAHWAKHYDPQYFSEAQELDLQAHGHTSVPISTFIEHKSIRIAREVEKYLIEKYTAMDGEDE